MPQIAMGVSTSTGTKTPIAVGRPGNGSADPSDDASSATIASGAHFSAWASMLPGVRTRKKGIEIISDNQYSGATVDSALQEVENLIQRFKTQE